MGYRGSVVKGTSIPLAFALLSLLHHGYVLLEAMVVASDGNSATGLREMRTADRRTCTPFSTLEPSKTKRVNVSMHMRLTGPMKQTNLGILEVAVRRVEVSV